jgi:hypothetical protein
MTLCRCCFLVAFRAMMVAVTIVTRRQQNLGFGGGFQAQRVDSHLIKIIPMFGNIRTRTSL